MEVVSYQHEQWLVSDGGAEAGQDEGLRAWL